MIKYQIGKKDFTCYSLTSLAKDIKNLDIVNDNEKEYALSTSYEALKATYQEIKSAPFHENETNLSHNHIKYALESLMKTLSTYKQGTKYYTQKPTKTIGIIMAGNVILSGLAAILKEILSGNKVIVRLSMRDFSIPLIWLKHWTHMFRTLPLIFAQWGGPSHNRLWAVDKELATVIDHIIVFGSEKALNYWRELKCTITNHGPGIGAAWINRIPDAKDCSGLAFDTILFHQSGCLSTQFVFFEGQKNDAQTLMERLPAHFDNISDKIDIKDGSLTRHPRVALDMRTWQFREKLGQSSLIVDTQRRWALSLEPLHKAFNWAGTGSWLRIFYGNAEDGQAAIAKIGHRLRSLTIVGERPPFTLTDTSPRLYPQPGSVHNPSLDAAPGMH